MSRFYEEILYEYPPIVKRKTFTKTVSYRIRVLKRIIDGIPRTLLDMREFVVNEKRAILLENGFYFNRDELKIIIPLLQDALKYFDRRPNDPRAGSGTSYTGLPKTED